LIFVALGTQEFQFERLLKELDKVVNDNNLTTKIVVQAGFTNYYSPNLELHDFMTIDEFNHTLDSCDIFITHGGTSNIFSALKKDKKVIVVPRLKKCKEHVDDHQTEISEFVHSNNFAMVVEEISNLYEAIKTIEHTEFDKYYNDNTLLINDLINYISKG